MLCSTASLEASKTKFDFTEADMCKPCSAFDYSLADPLKDSIGTEVYIVGDENNQNKTAVSEQAQEQVKDTTGNAEFRIKDRFVVLEEIKSTYKWLPYCISYNKSDLTDTSLAVLNSKQTAV